jgi:protoporphyrinogen oxidase
MSSKSTKPSLVPNPHAAPAPVRALLPMLGQRPVRRRDFLNGLLVGASGMLIGAGAAGCEDPKATEPALPPGNDKGDNNSVCHAVRDGKSWTIPAAEGAVYDCVIVGGGLSGLVTAYRLQKLGVKNVLVLEKEEPAGGFARLDGPADAAFAQASAYTVYPYNDNLIELYTDLGIVTGLDADGAAILDEKYVLDTPVNNSFIDGKWYAEPWDAGIDELPYPADVRADMKAFRDDMNKWYVYADAGGKFGFDTPTDASTEDADVRALDDVTFADYITVTKGWSPKVVEFYTPYCRSAFGADPDKLSAWAGINFFGSEFQPSMSQPGGNAHLAIAFAKKVGAANIKTKCFVLRIKNEGAEVHVSYLEGDVVKTVRAKTAVYAGPRYLAKYVLPDLVAAGRDEAKDFHYTPYIVANVHVTKTPAGLGYDNWIQEPNFFTDIVLADWSGLEDPAKASLDRPNTLSCYCPLIGPGKRAELLATPFEDYETQVLDDLEKVFPGIRETVTAVDLYRWGHAMLAAGKGFIFGASRVGSQKPEGLISFANHDVDGLPAFENAVGAAYRAADEVKAVVLP